jgi:sulfate-transporting ATPase
LTRGGYGGTPIRHPSIFGLDVNGVGHPSRYAAMLVVFLGLIVVAVANLRASPTGRRLLAIRGAERAASATGISLAATKTAAFVIAAAIASLGGVLIGFRAGTVTYPQFGLLSSLNLVVFTLIGGVGYIAGPVLGAAMSTNGLVTWLFNDLTGVQRWLTILSGFTLILTLIANPNGLASLLDPASRRRRRRRAKVAMTTKDPAPVRPARLEVDRLMIRYGSVVALDGLSLSVEPGSIVGLIGPNGAGKTTAIDAISGFCRIGGGNVALGGVDLTNLGADRRARAGLARTFQAVEPFDDLTVAENLAVATERVRWFHWLTDLVRRRPVALSEALCEEAQELGLVDLNAQPISLSQGHRRLLGVLRALAASPSVLLLDEPAAGLDKSETEHLGRMLRAIADERGIGMLLVEHDMSLIAAVCDHVVALDFGKTIFSGSVTDAVSDPLIIAAYLGELDDEPSGGRDGHRLAERSS